MPGNQNKAPFIELVRIRTAVDAHESGHQRLESERVGVDGIAQGPLAVVSGATGVVVQNLHKLALDIWIAQIRGGQENNEESEQIIEGL